MELDALFDVTITPSKVGAPIRLGTIYVNRNDYGKQI
jgi:hypothetical protein